MGVCKNEENRRRGGAGCRVDAGTAKKATLRGAELATRQSRELAGKNLALTDTGTACKKTTR